MNILLVSSYLPYPLHNGGNIRLYNLLKHLQRDHTITLICEMRPDQTQSDVKEVERVCEKVIPVPRRKQWSFSNILKTGFSLDPFLVVGHKSKKMYEVIQKELKECSFDLIHVETFYVFQNVPPVSLPVVLVEHNIEHVVYERYMKQAPFVLRPLLLIDILKMKHAEKNAWKKVTVVATVSEEEKNMIHQQNCFVVANGVDTKKFQQKSVPLNFATKDKTILYIGDYRWIQNRDAVTYIIHEIWPRIRSAVEEKNLMITIKLWLVGRNVPQGLKELGKGDSAIIWDDANQMTAAEIFSRADILLAPKRVGGGTSYKILEAMASGTPVVTNSIGLEGFDFIKNKDLLVADTPDELAKKAIELLTDEERYRTLSENGRKAVEKKYDWSAIVKQLMNVYTSALEK